MSLIYKEETLILGEGKADHIFFQQLIKVHGLLGLQTDYPVLGNDHTGGWTKIGRYLLGIGISESFMQNVKRIIVVGDNDEAASFDNICGQIRAAGYNAPASARQFVKTKNKPDIAALLIPDTHPGCLETLCYQAACVRWPHLQGPLDTYLEATSAATWSETKQAKMRVQCVLASTCEKKPDVALHDHWQKAEQYHIPVNAPAFESIVGFLTSI